MGCFLRIVSISFNFTNRSFINDVQTSERAGSKDLVTKFEGVSRFWQMSFMNNLNDDNKRENKIKFD